MIDWSRHTLDGLRRRLVEAEERYAEAIRNASENYYDPVLDQTLIALGRARAALVEEERRMLAWLASTAVPRAGDWSREQEEGEA